MSRVPETANPAPRISWEAVITPNSFNTPATPSREATHPYPQAPSILPLSRSINPQSGSQNPSIPPHNQVQAHRISSQSEAQTFPIPLQIRTPSIPPRSQSQTPSQQMQGNVVHPNLSDRAASSDSEESTGSTDSSSSSSSENPAANGQRKGNERKRKRSNKASTRKKKCPRLSNEDKKIVLRVCCNDFEIFAHARTKKRFWEGVQQKVKEETGKDHSSLHKAVKRWENSRRRVLKLITDGLFSQGCHERLSTSGLLRH